MKLVAAALLVALALWWLFAPSGRGSNPASANVEVEQCINRGIAYFKEIEAYPKLSTGRLADEVARERCNRTTTAFP